MRCGLLGEKLGHSYSKAIHERLGGYSYELIECPRAELDAFMKSGSFDAINVTIPYKKAVIPYCAALSPIAERIDWNSSSNTWQPPCTGCVPST